MPVVPDISVLNNRDGTATVSITGSDESAVNTVCIMRIDHQWPEREWLEKGDRVGDGDVVLSDLVGVFWFAVKSTVDTETSWTFPRYAAISSGNPPMFDQVVNAVVARIQLLLLDGIDSSNVIPQMLLTANEVRGLRENHILVGQMDGEQPLPGGPTNRDRYGYPVVIALAAPANRDQEKSAKWNQWREFIIHAFQNQWLVTATGEVLIAKYVPVSGPIKQFWERNCYASLIGFEFMSEQSRGMRI